MAARHRLWRRTYGRMMASPRFENAALIVNAASRSGASAFETARDHLRALGIPLTSCHPVREPERLPEVLAHVVEKGHDLVIIGGGDGSLSTAVDLLAHRDVTLGVLPLGTANDFARTLGIPSDLRAACATIAGGKLVDVDLGQVGDNHFVNLASVGLSVGVSHALAPSLKKRLGPIAYPIAAAVAYRRHRPFTAWLEFPDDDHEPVRLDDLLQVAIGNGRHYGGGNVVAPDATIDDQLLDVYAVFAGRLRDHLSMARLLRDGSFVEHDHAMHLTTQRVTLRTDPEQLINVDGEVVASTPETFVVDHNALDVVVPLHATAAHRDRAEPSKITP